MTRPVDAVRLFGDPFGDDAAAGAMRAFGELARARSFRVALSLTPVRAGPPVEGATLVPLTDGARTFTVPTRLPPAAIDILLRAAAEPLPATAPVVVFAPDARERDAVQLAALEWPRACNVWAAGSSAAEDLLRRVEHGLRAAGREDPPHGLDETALRPWLELPPPRGDGPVLHVGSADPDDGTDLAVRAFFAFGRDGRRLRIVLDSEESAAFALEQARRHMPDGVDPASLLELRIGPPLPEHARDCAAVLQPIRRLRAPTQLVALLASGRPVIVTRFAGTAPLLAPPGICQPLGGRRLDVGEGDGPRCEPDPRGVAAGLRAVLGDVRVAAAIGRRAQSHVVAELTCGRPATPRAPDATHGGDWTDGPALVMPAAARRARPVVVLEAPFLETSSAAELSIDTAEALRRRGNVELRLVAAPPFRHDLPAFRGRAPALASLLARDPGEADLWLASGWPPRADRPRCGTFALRIDWEYGALPFELCPLVTDEADLVVVHSRHVLRTVVEAGRSPDRIALVPHGVDGEVFCDDAAPLCEIVQWKGDLPAVLFVGGLVFRKGVDVLLRMALAAAAAGRRFALVLKGVGHDQHYAGFHLGELVRRFQATPGAPPLRWLDGELSRRELAGLYRACNLLCHPYRGEGFGLPVLEARACGLPVVVTSGGATDDFARGPGTLSIAAARRSVALPVACVAEPWLLEPDAPGAAAMLLHALDELPALQAAARSAAAAVRARHAWDAAAAAIERLATAARPSAIATVRD